MADDIACQMASAPSRTSSGVRDISSFRRFISEIESPLVAAILSIDAAEANGNGVSTQTPEGLWGVLCSAAVTTKPPPIE